MNILEIAQAFAYEVNVDAPSTLLSLTDPADLQILNLIYSVSRDLRQARCWPQQKKTYSFTLSANRTKYPLPQDFYSALLRTQWDQDRRWNLNGPATDAEFTNRLYGVATSQNQITYRMFGPDAGQYTAGGQFNVYPTPSGGEDLYYEYITKNMFIPTNWTPSTVVALNSYISANGNIYKYTTGGTTNATTAPSHTSGTVADGTAQALYISAPYETVIANTDQSLFDEDIVILGLKAKWYQMKGLEYEPLQAEFQSKIDQADARWNGSYIGSFNRAGRFIRRYGPSTAGGWSL